MTSVDEFVRHNILTFPSIFPNRTAVLHHALCVIGTGYQWSDEGTVVTDAEPFPLWNKEKVLAELEDNLRRDFDNEEIREVVGAALRKQVEECVTVVEEVETRIHARDENMELHFPKYPAQSEFVLRHSLLSNIPSNVTPDWLEACNEMKQFAEKAGAKF